MQTKFNRVNVVIIQKRFTVLSHTLLNLAFTHRITSTEFIVLGIILEKNFSIH